MSANRCVLDDNQAIRLASGVLEQALADAETLLELARKRAWRKTSRQQAMRWASWFVGIHAELTAFLRSGRYGLLMEGMVVNEFHFRDKLARSLSESAGSIEDAKEVLAWVNNQGRKPRGNNKHKGNEA